MRNRTAHGPKTRVMSIADVLEDARRLEVILGGSAPTVSHDVQITIPFSALLGALDRMTREELIALRQRLDERLAG
jgi:hypothetical protein